MATTRVRLLSLPSDLVREAFREAAGGDNDLYMCPVVFYELWRGLAYRDARRQLEDLDAFAWTLQWVDMTTRIS